MTRLLLLCLLSLCYKQAYSLDNSHPLPEPLSFQDALSFAENQFHYSFQYTQSMIDVAQASKLEQSAKNDLKVDLKGYLRKVGVSDLGDSSNDNDSKISLLAQKNLYDFGETRQQERLSDDLILLRKAEFKLQKERYLNNVVAAYFNVLKVDNQYLADNENMSIAYIRFNRAEQNAEFGLTSELDILKAQANYEKVRQQRYLSESQQRFTRQILAELLGTTTLSDLLETPVIDTAREITDDVVSIVDLALMNSHEIKVQHAKLTLSNQALKVASRGPSATIDAALEINEYQRDTPSRDKWRASINFNVPLYSGEKKGFSTAVAKSKYQSALSDMSKAQSDLRIKILSLWQTIKQKKMEFEGAIIKQEYRDLYLEESRANYELEYKSDLGDSMVQFSRSRAARYAVEFDLEIAWREMSMLVGIENIEKILKVTEK